MGIPNPTRGKAVSMRMWIENLLSSLDLSRAIGSILRSRREAHRAREAPPTRSESEDSPRRPRYRMDMNVHKARKRFGAPASVRRLARCQPRKIRGSVRTQSTR